MSKEILKIDTAVPTIGKSGKPFHKVNGNLFCFDKEMGRLFEDNIGKTYEVEADRTTEFHKIKLIYGETDKAPEVVRPGIEVKPKEVVKEELLPVKQNSRTLGKGSDQVKIYFDTAEDLNNQIIALEKVNLMPADWGRPDKEDLGAEPQNN